MLWQLLFFILVSVGSGYAILKLSKHDSDDWPASLFLSIPVGLSVFVLEAIVLDAFGMLRWELFGFIAIALFILMAPKSGYRLPQISIPWLIVIGLAILHLYVYTAGALSYPWLEDDDPWDHASATLFISEFHTFIQPQPAHIHYLAPYPPFYDVLMGMLYQVGGTTMAFTLKFYNALLISLCIPLGYLFFRELTDDRSALFGTLVLTALPSFMSHFIWAQSLGMLFLLASLYATARWLKGHSALYAPFLILAMAVTQPSVAAIGTLMIVLFILSYRSDKPNLSDFLYLAIGLAMAAILFWIPMFGIYGIDGVFSQISVSLSFVTDKMEDTGGGIIYGLSDIIDAPFTSRMDQPTGWGIGIFMLVVLGLAFAVDEIRKGRSLLPLLALFIFCLLGLEGNALPIKLMPHRFWVFLAIPAAALSGLAMSRIEATLKPQWFSRITVLAIILVIVIFSASAKWFLEGQSQWPPGVSFVSANQLAGYVNLSTSLPANTKVFSFCSPENLANGFNLFGYQWEDEVYNYKAVSIADTNDANHQFLTRYNYTYLVIDQSCLLRYTPEQISAKVDTLVNDKRFELSMDNSQPAFLVFRVV